MASPITFGGLASGLDTKSIIAALVAVEGRKVTLLQQNRADFQKKVSTYDDLLSKLKSLQNATETLADADSFVAHTVKLSDGGGSFLSATTTGTAAAGSYQVQISSLAQSTFLRSAGAAASDTSLGLTGTLSIQVGTTVTNITVDATNDSLLGLRDAINDSAAEVKASVVFDGTDYHLELRGAETGVANAVTILAEPPGAGGPVLNLAQQRAAADAAFTIDGQAYTSASNTVTDAIQGVTLQLLDDQAVTAAPIQVTLAEDFEGVKKQLQSFINAYNDVIKILNTQAAPRSSNEEAVKPLAGESALRSIRSAFASILASQADVGSKYKSLASIGIKSTSDGTLKLTDKSLADALAADLDGVVALFTDATEGVASRLSAAVDARTKPVTGVIDSRKNAFNQSVRNLDDRIRRAQDALDVYEKGLVQRFSQYEQLIGNLQAQGASLGSIGSTTSSN